MWTNKVSFGMIEKKNGRKFDNYSGGYFLAERVLGDEVTFNLRRKTSNARCKRIQRGLALRYSA